MYWFLSFSLVLQVACKDATNRNSGTFIRDSVGVRVVENSAASWSQESAWHVKDSAIVDIGSISGPDPYQLFDVRGARRLSDGRIVIANAGTGELRFYGGEGRYLYSAGGKGGGPGEFMRLDRIFITPGDSIVAYDRPNVRIFDREGTYLHSVLIGGFGSETFLGLRPVGLLGSHVLILSAWPDYWKLNFTDGVNRKPGAYAAFDFSTGAFDSLGTYPGYTTYVERTGQGVSQRVYPFGKSAEIVAGGDRIVIGDNKVYALEVQDGRGRLQMIIRVQRRAIPVTAELLERWIEERLVPYDATPQQRAQWARDFRNLPVAKTQPAFGSLAVDREGNIWVQDYQVAGEAWTYQVLSGDGIWLGGVRLPDTLEPLDIGDDYVLGLWRDGDDVEHVRLHRLIKPGG